MSKKEVKKESKPLTSDEKLKLLKGYEKYDDPASWTSIPIGAHIRLLKKDGTFIRGGFVRNFYTNDGNQYLMLENNKFDRTHNYMQIKIKLDNVKRIFVKPDNTPTMSIPTPSLPTFEEPSTRIQGEEIELLEKKIDLMEKIISQKDSELNSLRKRVGALESTTSGIMKYLKQRAGQ